MYYSVAPLISILRPITTIGQRKSIGSARDQPLKKARSMPETAMARDWSSYPYF